MRVLSAAAAVMIAFAPAQERPQEQGFSFRSNVDLINVTVTVTDSSGRFVSGLNKDDFDVYEDGVLQQTSHFDAERVPVKWIAVARDQNSKCVLRAGENAAYDLLVGIDLIDRRACWFHRGHDASVTRPASCG